MLHKTITILVGIPCAGKSSYTEKTINRWDYAVISRDQIRDAYFEKPYLHKKYTEEQVGKIFYEQFKRLLIDESITHIIVDNTHCKEKYIDVYIDKLIKKTYKDFTVTLQIKYFDIPLWEAKMRNILRFLKTGRWVPMKVISDMYKNYKKLNRKKYEQYVVH